MHTDYSTIKRRLENTISDSSRFVFEAVLKGGREGASFDLWARDVIDLLSQLKTLGGGPHTVATEAYNQYPSIALLPHDDDAFESCRAALTKTAEEGIRLIERHENQQEAQTSNIAKVKGEEVSSIDVFISHSSKDEDIATLLIDLLRVALNLESNKILCTSVDGHRLPGGVSTDDTLRKEVRQSKAFVGLLTPHSLASAYVLFELGARWETEKSMMPLLAKGASKDMLVGPLPGINVLDSNSNAQLHQMLEELAPVLGKDLDRPSAYQKCIDRIIEFNQAATSDDISDQLQREDRQQTLKLTLKEALFHWQHISPGNPGRYEAFLEIYVSSGIGESAYLPENACSCSLSVPGFIDSHSLEIRNWFVPNDSRYIIRSGKDLAIEGPGSFYVEADVPADEIGIPEGYTDAVKISFQCLPNGVAEPVMIEANLTHGKGKGRKAGGDWRYPNPSSG